MECLFCGSPMDCVQSEVKPVPGSWHLSYAVAWWECDECGAEAIFDGGVGPLDDPVEWTAPPEEEP
jgi:hypothetical protein